MCIRDSISGEAYVTTLTPPTADFVANPDTMSIIYTSSQAVDKSTGNIISWMWDFGDNSTYSIQNPYHTYKDSIAIYQITLIVEDNQGCVDTTQKLVTITDEHWLYIPNSFTPDLDGVNDKFCIEFNGIRKNTFYINIFDRFSNLVFSTSNIDNLSCEKGWNGTHYQSGNEVPMGLYICQIYYHAFDGWKHQEISELTIIR